MVFTHPFYVWALLGLLVPLAIHLWSKKEAKTIKIGSIQLFDESNSRQSSSIQLNEWLLLLLRMSIIGLVVMLMAGPQWRSNRHKDRITYLVEPSLVHKKELTSLLDSLSNDFPVYFLDNGFPEWDSDVNLDTGKTIPNYWQLAQKMDSLPSDSIVVFTHAYLQGVKSMRPTVHRNIHWIVLDPETPLEKPLAALRDEKGAQLLSVFQEGRSIRFERENLAEDFQGEVVGDSLQIATAEGTSTVPIIHLDTITVNMHAGEDFEMDQNYLKTALKALSLYLDRSLQINELDENEALDITADLNIWLDESPLQRTEGKWLVYENNPTAKKLIEPTSNPNYYALTSRLTLQNTVEENVTEQLIPLLDLEAELQPLVAQVDNRQMDVGELSPNFVGETKKRAQSSLKDITPYVLLMLSLLMIVERIVSKIRRQ